MTKPAMNEQSNSPTILGEALLQALRQAIRQEIEAALQSGHAPEDRLLDAPSAAKLLSVSSDWVYRHAKSFPFTRKLGPKMLRFSFLGIQKYLATRKTS